MMNDHTSDSLTVRQLHREFLRAGADVMQTFTFFASDASLTYDEGEKEKNNNKQHKLTVSGYFTQFLFWV